MNTSTGVISATLIQRPHEARSKNVRPRAHLAIAGCAGSTAEILPHPASTEWFQQKIGELLEALDNAAIRPEAVSIIAQVVESAAFYPDGDHGLEASMP
ncbi:hypothetical protein [Sandarakinorhabdus sp. DWP1-3-1]|uniref:hypothetical protein n=1 Tax=Sandarakinorhabdus sp. DWP1-3-1 TaxID=2804627 RepID=UPI003CF2DDFA